MKIYVDVLIITNAIVTLIFLQCIQKIMHEQTNVKREAAASAIGGAGSLIAAIESESFLGALALTLAKGGIIWLIIITAFGRKNFIAAAKRFFLYILCELIFGGVCLLIVDMTHKKIVMIKNYTIYFDVSLLQIAVCCLLVYAIISIYETVQRVRAANAQTYHATYSLGNLSVTLPAVADSGNKLCDSFTGEPVVIFRSDELYCRYDLDCPEKLAFYGFHPAPYSTLNGGGIVYVTSKGKVEISSNSGTKRINCSVGIIPSGPKTQCAVFDPRLLG